MPSRRLTHYLVLLVAAFGLNFINLGVPSLWDIDEGHNAQAAREMMESGSWIVPTFNYHLRVDKPALLYWLQIGAYRLFDVSEFAARLPSALAAIASVLLTYEFARRLWGAATGLIAGLILNSSFMFCASAHFANPDSLLNALTILTLCIFWLGFEQNSDRWLVPAGLSAGLAVLAKGPVGLALPFAVIIIFLVSNGRWRFLIKRRLALGLAAFLLVALPWYIWVGAATHMEFWRGFFLTHNLGRFRAPMEGHTGSVIYYPLCLLIGFAPWSIFFGLTIWSSLRNCQLFAKRRMPGNPAENAEPPGSALATRFLCCWILVYLAFFSLAATKLPNYILPVYAPFAVLTARLLEHWRSGLLAVPRWSLYTSMACLALLGAGLGLGLLVAGGAVQLPYVRVRALAGLENGVALGIIPIFGAILGWWCLRRNLATGMIAAVAVSAVLLTGWLAAWGAGAVDRHKGPRPLTEAYRTAQPSDPDIRVGCYLYYQPSLVFYARREIFRLNEPADALEFLQYPVPVYLLTPSIVWNSLQERALNPHRIVGRHWDLYQNCEVTVVTNR